MFKLIDVIKQTGLKISIQKQLKDELLFEFDVQAKPGSKKESIEIQNGVLIIKTSSRPIEGEANKSIIEKVSEIFGVSKSCADIIRGDKSKSKRIKLLVQVTANKKENHFIEAITSALR